MMIAARSAKRSIIRYASTRHFSRKTTTAAAAAAAAAGASSASSSSSSSWNYDYDILIVGGGVVGAALGCKLASSPVLKYGKSLRIGIVEGRPPPPLSKVQAKQVPDARVYSFTPTSCRLLQRVGVWNELIKRAQPFDSMQVWDSRGEGYIRFGVDDVAAFQGGNGGRELGYILENSCLQASLFEKLKELEEQGRISVLCPMQVEAMSDSDQGWKGAEPLNVVLKGAEADAVPQEVRARLVIAADGGNSKVRKLRGLATWGWGYGQRAVVATLKVEAPHTTAWQRFLPTGPLALLPLWDGYSSIVWSTTPSEAERLKALTEDKFLEEINSALRSEPVMSKPPAVLAPAMSIANEISKTVMSLGMLADKKDQFQLPPRIIACCSGRFGFDLSLQQATKYTAPRIAMVGDAAHTIHPMAGQGLNLGLADVQSLAKVIEKGFQNGADLGSPVLLSDYENDRKTKNLAMMSGMQVLHHLFGTTSAPVALLRNTGFGLLNAAGPVKAQIAKLAMQ